MKRRERSRQERKERCWRRRERRGKEKEGEGMSTLGRGGEEMPNLGGGGGGGEERGGKGKEKNMGRKRRSRRMIGQHWEESDQNIPRRPLRTVFYRITHLGSSFPRRLSLCSFFTQGPGHPSREWRLPGY